MATKIFAAYPGSSTPIGDCMRGAVDKLKAYLIELQPWQQNDICGVVLTDPIFSEIRRLAAISHDAAIQPKTEAA